MWASATSAVYHPYTYIYGIFCPLINTPHPEGVITSQPKTSFLVVVFDGDHDFVGPRSPKAHLDTLNAIGNLLLTGGSTVLDLNERARSA